MFGLQQHRKTTFPDEAGGPDSPPEGAAFLVDYAVGTTASFLRQAGAAAGTLGDINIPRPVTGAPSGTNAVVILPDPTSAARARTP